MSEQKESLIERLEKASDGKDADLARCVWEAATGECTHRETRKWIIEDGNDYESGFTCIKCGAEDYGVPPYAKLLTSLDAALALCERVLPGWRWGVHCHPSIAGQFRVALTKPSPLRPIPIIADHCAPALAFCLAILRARASLSQGEKE